MADGPPMPHGTTLQKFARGQVAGGNPLRPREALLRRYAIYASISVVVAAMSIHLFVYGTDWSRMGSPEEILSSILTFAPDVTFIPSIVAALLETALMAVWGTLLAILLSIPVIYLAASNITPSMLLTYPLGRGLIVVSRSTHEIIFALLFVAALGLGPLPGILALAMRSVGFMAKTTAEAVEHVSRGPIEAIEATGANQTLRLVYAIVPQVLPIFLGNAIFQLDINLRRAAILGVVGAGGIGLQFTQQMQAYNYDKAGACVLGIVAVVILGEAISNRLRTRIFTG